MKLFGYDWPQGGRKQVVYVDDQRHVIELQEGLDLPWESANLTELTGAPPAGGFDLVGYTWSVGGTKQVAYVDNRKHVIELVGAAGKPWQWADLSELTGAPLPCSTSLVGYDWYNGNTKQVVYVDDQGHVIELVGAAGNPWQWADLTELTGAPHPSDSSLVGYGWSNGATKQVVYVDSRGHVIELFVAAGNPWQWADLTELTGAPHPVDTALVGYAWSAGGTKQVVYVDGRGHVIELFVAAGNPWQWSDLSELTGAPPPVDTALVGYAWSAGGTKQVVYVDSRGHVIELFVAAGNLWQWSDLSELTRAPLTVQESLAGYDWLNGNTKQVVYVDDQGHVIELLVTVGNPWQRTDLTALTQAPLLHQKPLSGYGSVWGATKQVVYEDDQGRVIELWSGFGDQWHYAILLQSAERRPV